MIRNMTEEDVDFCIELGKSMHEESYFRQFDYNFDKLKVFVTNLVNTPEQSCALVAIKEGQIIGFFLGISNEHWFGTDKMSCDLACYIIPSERGSMTATKLIKQYEKWAKEIGVKEMLIGVSTGVNSDRTASLFERLGYGDKAFSLRKRI
tara:strand:+ start:298 stop:747 length:450 start_codon:yes stop_codon:yes gene_type:complete